MESCYKIPNLICINISMGVHRILQVYIYKVELKIIFVYNDIIFVYNDKCCLILFDEQIKFSYWHTILESTFIYGQLKGLIKIVDETNNGFTPFTTKTIT